MEVLGPGIFTEPPQLTALSIICVPKQVGKPKQVATTAFANTNNVMRQPIMAKLSLMLAELSTLTILAPTHPQTIRGHLPISRVLRTTPSLLLNDVNLEAHRTREPALSINRDQNADQLVEEQAAVITELQPVREQAPLGSPLTPAGTDGKIRQYAEIDHQK